MILQALVGLTLIVSLVVPAIPSAAQEVIGTEHWVEQAGTRIYVWEKYLGSPQAKKVVVLAHGSATAGKESFDLQVPGKPSYSLMDVLAREGFDVFALDTRGFGRSVRPSGHITAREGWNRCPFSHGPGEHSTGACLSWPTPERSSATSATPRCIWTARICPE